MRILAIGPYVGDFEEEFNTFRPYSRWLERTVKYDKIYLNTHSNRHFLYHYIPEENLLPVNEYFTRYEEGQNGYIHNELIQKDYNMMVKDFKNFISKKENCSKRDIYHYNLKYVKSKPVYPLYNKIFEKIHIPDIEIPIIEDDYIVLIPYNGDMYIYDIYKKLKEEYNCIVIGDVKCALQEYNEILTYYIDYAENGWKYIFKYILDAKAVICPVSYWTTICNLHGYNVFSWGEYVGQHKNKGVYSFGNTNSFIMSVNEETEEDEILKYIRGFLEAL